MYKNYTFNVAKEHKFYRQGINVYADEIYNKSNEYWDVNRREKLNKNEKGIYKLLDTLTTVPKFKQIYNLVSILGSGNVEFNN